MIIVRGHYHRTILPGSAVGWPESLGHRLYFVREVLGVVYLIVSAGL